MITSDQLAAKLKEIADDLAHEIRAVYGETRFRYKLEQDRFNRDMKTVDSAYELLDLYREQKEADEPSPFERLMRDLGIVSSDLDPA